MTQTAEQLSSLERAVLDQLVAMGDGTLELEMRVDLAQAHRSRSRERSRHLDWFLIEQLLQRSLALAEASEQQQKLRELVANVLAPPWQPAVFVRLVDGVCEPPRALVSHAGVQRVVSVAEEVDADELMPGDEVYLSKELNLLVAHSLLGAAECGETATFERWVSTERVILKWRDETVVARAAAPLRDAPLAPGDLVRWDRNAWVAFEKIERADGRQFLLDDLPDMRRDQIGGQDANVELIISALTATLVAPERAASYGLSNRHSILLYGPPGCGKTMQARFAAAEVGRLTGKRCRLAVVKPAQWESPWVGETQRNIRDCFRALREAARESFAILFVDEIESVGRIRGGAVSQHSDKFLAALLAELDGFSDREGIAIISATNRKDLVDPALLERLSDVEIAVRRPDLRGARSIFEIHLPASIPYSPNGASAAATRNAVIDTAVSRFYSPNADNALCVIGFRDGKTRTVAARELASGRIFEQICRAACRAAFHREVRGGEAGVSVPDIEDAIADTLERLATTLTPRNAHAYLADLPQDVDVVSVEPLKCKQRRPHRYLNESPVRH